MSHSTHAILFGKRTLDEIAAAVQASGLVETPYPEKIPGNSAGVIGTLRCARAGQPSPHLTSLLWAFDGALNTDFSDVYPGERTVLSASVVGTEIVEAITRTFGGYICRDDREPDWQVVEPQNAEFTPEDRLHVDLAKILGPKEAESMMQIVGDLAKRKALIRALEAFASATERPFDLRENLESPGMM